MTYSKRNLIVATLLIVMAAGMFAPLATAQSSDFNMFAGPGRQVISPGMSTAYRITVASINGFESPVQLSVSSGLPSSVSAEFFPSSTVTPSSDGSEFAVLIVQASQSASSGTYTLTITGSGGGHTYSSTVTLVVTRRTTFAVSVEPTSRTIGKGNDKEYQVTVTSLESFSGTVNLSAMAQTSDLSVSLNPTSVYLSAGSTAEATMDVSVSADTSSGSYVVMVRGSNSWGEDGSWRNWPSGCHYWNYWDDGCFSDSADIHFAFATVQVPSVSDFQISLSSNCDGETLACGVLSQSVTVDQVAFFTVRADAIGGFASDIQLDLAQVPQGVDFAFNPATLSPTEDNSATSTLTIKPSTSAMAGTYSLDVTATSQGTTRMVPLSLTITSMTTSLTLTVPYSGVKRGDQFMVTGIITPAIPGASISVLYTRPDGTVFMHVVQAASDGTFTDQYTPQTANLVGTWKVKAQYFGNAAHSGATSPTYPFQVVEMTFPEQYNLLWLADNALWIVLLIFALIFIVFAIVWCVANKREYRETRPAPPPPPIVQPPAVVWVATQPPPPVPAPYTPALPPTKACYNCGRIMAGGDRFCDGCGAPQGCNRCGRIITGGSKFCDACGAPQ